MYYTNSITSKGQITIPKEFRDKLGLDKTMKATLSLNDQGEVILTAPKTLDQVRSILAKPSHKDAPSDREKQVGSVLATRYGVR